MEEKIKNNYRDEYAFITSLIVESYKQETSRIKLGKNSEYTVEDIDKTICYLFLKLNLYSFFNPVSLEVISSLIKSDSKFQMFLLNYTDRLNIALFCNQVDIQNFYNSLIKGILASKSSNKYNTIIDKNTKESIDLSKDVIGTIFNEDSHIVALYLLLLNVHQIESIKHILDNTNISKG